MSRLFSEVDFRRAAGVGAVLGHPERLRTACRPRQGAALTRHQLLEDLPWAQPAVVRHLGVLRARTLVAATRQGNEFQPRWADGLVQLPALVRHHPPGEGASAGAPAARPGGARQ